MSTSPTSDKKAAPRVSARKNKGIPAVHFTFSDKPGSSKKGDTLAMKKEDLEQSTVATASSSSSKATRKRTPSIRSRSSTKSVELQKKEADISFKKQVLEMERRKKELEKNRRGTQAEVKKLERQLRPLYEKEELTAEEEEVKKDLDEKRDVLENILFDVGDEVNLLERELDILKDEHEATKMMIDEEETDEEEDDGDSNDPSFCTAANDENSVDEWVAKQVLTTPLATSTPILPHSSTPPPTSNTAKAEVTSTDQLLERFVTVMESGFGNKSNEVIIKSAVDKELPTFDGNPKFWLRFYNSFNLTTEKYKFSNAENMARVTRALQGKAANAVEHYYSNPDNLKKLMSSLELQFGRPEFVLDCLISNVREATPPDINKPETIIEFGTALESLVTNIESFHRKEYLENRPLVSELVKKLPPAMKTQWFDWIEDRELKPNLENFANWMARRMKSAILSVEPTFSKSEESEEKRRKPKRGSGAVNATTGEETSDSKGIRCPICNAKSHDLVECRVFLGKSVSDRWKVVKERKPRACIGCLTTAHKSSDCPDSTICGLGEPACTYHHHHLLHQSPRRPPTEKPDSNASDSDQARGSINVTITNGEAIIKGCDGPLPIVPGQLRGPKGTANTYVLLDSAASGTLILDRLANSVGLDGEDHAFSFTTADGNKIVEEGSKLVDAEIAGQFRGAKFYPIRNAVTVSRMKMRPYSINVERIKALWPYLNKVKAKTLHNVVPEIIIGNKNPTLILPREIVEGPPDSPVGWRTPLGWTISGEIDNPRKLQIGSVNMIASTPITNDYLHHLMKTHFSLENFGVVPTSRKGNNEMEAKSYRILEETARKVGNRWECGLLWKSEDLSLPPSYPMALKRLLYTEKKMKDPVFASQYRAKINEYLEKGYIRKLMGHTATFNNGVRNRNWHIPHFGVINPNKPGKFRLVFDAAARSNGVCLNDALMKGPDLIRPLISVLWNFRRHRIPLSGDIADMFHRVFMIEEDRSSQRFLWRDGDPARIPDIYEMIVLIFGATSSPSSAIYIKNRNAELFRNEYPEAVDAIIEEHYVDDCLTGGESDEAVIKLRKEISQISESGGFHVCKWNSTSASVIESIPPELRAEQAKEIGQDPTSPPIERVLGMWLDHDQDLFTFRLTLHKVAKEILDGQRPTKRNVCSLVMSLYDPLGFISHYKIKGIMILQRLWRAGVEWEDEIPTDVYEDWKQWLKILPAISNVKVPRWLGDVANATNITLHTFVDASEEAYAAVSYLVVNTGAGTQIAFIGSKSRVSPLKKMTIPRMELMAALLGSRFGSTIEKELRVTINRRVFWSDSRTVLSWILSEAQTFKEFVANRIGEIQEITNATEWKWIPTNLNVADIATRYSTEISSSPENVWFAGPEFLLLPEDEWPKESKKVEDAVVAATATEIQWSIDCKQITPRSIALKSITPEMERFSSFSRLIRATAAVKVAANQWLSRTRKRPYVPIWRKLKSGKIDSNYSNISSNDLDKAEITLVQLAQEEFLGDEIERLRRQDSVKPKKRAKQKKLQEKNIVIYNKIIKLLPFEEDGLLKVNGRLMNANISESAKTPIILPNHHHFTRLLIQREHENCAHQGRETVLNNLRRKYWIVDGRQSVLTVTQRCGVCRLRRAHPIIPQMAHLPTHRLAAYQPAFTFTGLDYLGPFEVTVGRHHEKRWVALFTCLVTRGVHLEVAHGLTTDEAIMAISRFADTRGRPRVIHCDNGTNFVGAARALKKAEAELDFEAISAHGKFQGIDWRFNPPAAPHCGGAWERLVRSVKKCLNSTLQAKFPHDTTFLTAIKGVEGILNSRPITHVSNDPSDPEALTPNHFLRGACDAGPPIPATPDEDDNWANLKARWKRAQLLTHQFWEQWTRDYIPKMMLREKWRETTEPIKLGELVFMVDGNQPRNTWIRGYVSKIYRATDGQVRSVDVSFKTREEDLTQRRTVSLKRHVSGVCPLGVYIEIPEAKLPKSGTGTVAETSLIVDDDEDKGESLIALVHGTSEI